MNGDVPNRTPEERDPEDFDERDWDGEGLEGDDELGEDCHGYFESQSKSAVFICGAVGSEDCDECPMHDWLGLTSRQIDELEMSDEQ